MEKQRFLEKCRHDTPKISNRMLSESVFISVLRV